jgi:hypothetical protein
VYLLCIYTNTIYISQPTTIPLHKYLTIIDRSSLFDRSVNKTIKIKLYPHSFSTYIYKSWIQNFLIRKSTLKNKRCILQIFQCWMIFGKSLWTSFQSLRLQHTKKIYKFFISENCSKFFVMHSHIVSKCTQYSCLWRPQSRTNKRLITRLDMDIWSYQFSIFPTRSQIHTHPIFVW